MTKLELFKNVVSTVVGLGASKIARDIIANNVEVDTTVDHITVTAGSFVIGAMAADATKKHTDRMIDEIADQIKTIRNQINAI